MSGGRFSHRLGGGRKTRATHSAAAADEHVSTSSPMQLALVDYLATKRYDAHLRRLRRTLAERKQQAWQSLLRHMPAGSKFTITTAATFYGWNCRHSWMRGC
jgi:DNA-binding transcriptional MocR family regulator